MRQAMQQADEACYQSKAAGRNRVALYDSGVVAAGDHGGLKKRVRGN